MSVAVAVPTPAALARRAAPVPSTPCRLPAPVPSRRCARCRASKPLDDFPLCVTRRSGRLGVCAPCVDAEAATDPESTWRMCASKRAYPSFEDAVRAALDANRRRGTPLRVYACPHGEHHHLTKRTSWAEETSGVAGARRS